jgi:serine/threonine-protein kinase RsbW
MTDTPPRSRSRVAGSAGELPHVAGTLPATAESVTELRGILTRFAGRLGVGDCDCDRIALAVTEAAANVVMHAYLPRQQGTIHYVADLEENDLQVIVGDEGEGIRTASRSSGLGVGLNLIAAMTSDFTITERSPRGLDVWMRFVLDPAR